MARATKTRGVKKATTRKTKKTPGMPVSVKVSASSKLTAIRGKAVGGIIPVNLKVGAKFGRGDKVVLMAACCGPYAQCNKTVECCGPYHQRCDGFVRPA